MAVFEERVGLISSAEVGIAGYWGLFKKNL